MGSIPVTTATKVFSKALRGKWEAYRNTNGRRTAIQMGGVMTISPFPWSLGAPKVLQYKLEANCDDNGRCIATLLRDRKPFQPEFGAYRGSARILKSPLNNQNCRNKLKIPEKGTFIFCAEPWYAPNPGSKEIWREVVVVGVSDILLNLSRPYSWDFQDPACCQSPTLRTLKTMTFLPCVSPLS